MSKKGKQYLYKDAKGVYNTSNDKSIGTNCLETVFENGKLVKEYTFDEIRQNATI